MKRFLSLFMIYFALLGIMLLSPTATFAQYACNISGTWSSNWGDMTFVQNGNTVTGTYTHDKGRINGVMYGNELKGSWSEAPSYQPSNDAGDIRFTFTDNCQKFTGDWRYGIKQEYGSLTQNRWNGTRKSGGNWQSSSPPSQPAVQSCNISGAWSSNWGDMTFVQNGNSVTGTYTHDNGRINGVMYGNELKGSWSEAPSYQPSSDAGDIRFTFTDNCQKFTGDWRYGIKQEYGSLTQNRWNGTRK